MAQHMMQYVVTGKPAAPMPSRISAWAVYDVFSVEDDEQIFLAVVSDTQWAIFCDAFGLADMKTDPRLQTNNLRVEARGWMMPLLRNEMARYGAPSCRQCSSNMVCRSPRSRGRTTCWTIRICWKPAAWRRLPCLMDAPR